ncbi:hypothetical protein [Streptomyces sp. NPDC046332]|uniref:hypothetical protein n=1 Tax=unclassified Streptomyces TaxID=2593676 RepID=UPI0033CBC9C7
MPGEFAAFNRNPTTINICGNVFLIPYRPAAAWALDLHRLHVLAARLADDNTREELADLVIAMPAAAVELHRESLRLLADATGWRWWEAARLLSSSGAPALTGRLTLAGVDPWAVSVGQWCAATYSILAENKDEKDRLKLDFQLSIPPPGFEDEWDDDADDPEQIAAAMAKMMG